MALFNREIFSGITRIASPFKGILLDAYGVFWGGNDRGVLPGAKEAMEKLVSMGKMVGVLSNSTQLAFKEINKLHSHDLILGKHFHFLLTSGEAARSVFMNEKIPFKITNHKFWLFGKAHTKYASHEAIFQGTRYSEASHIDEADFIYISIPHIDGNDQVDPEIFREEIERLKAKKIPMFCPNPDSFAHEGNPPRAVVRQGSIAKMYEEVGGQVFYIGKPYHEVYSMAMAHFAGFRPEEVLMVGDTPETDIRGARLFGIPSALLTQTGIMADRIALNGLENALISSDQPDYLVERLKDDL